MRTDGPTNDDSQHSGEPFRARGAGRRPKENEVHQIVGATVGAEERMARAQIGAARAPKHL